MQDSIRSYISTGLIHFMAYPNTMKGEGPIEETIRRIALDDYFDSIEVTWIKDPEVRKNCAKLLKESKMRVYYGGQPRLLTTGYNPNALDEEQRLAAFGALRPCAPMLPQERAALAALQHTLRATLEDVIGACNPTALSTTLDESVRNLLPSYYNI